MSPPGRTKSQHFARSLSLLVTTALALALAWVAVTRWDEISSSFTSIWWPRLLAAAAFMTLGVVLTAECWRRWLVALGGGTGVVESHKLFYLTQAAKYVPGSVWPFAAQAAISRRYDIPRVVILTASVLFLISHTVTGGIAAGGWVEAAPGIWRPVLIPLAALGVALLTPPGLSLAMRAARRMRPGSFQQVRVTWSVTLATTVLMLAAWVAYGWGSFLLAQPLGLSRADFPTVIGAYAVGWLVGFLFVPSPAGLGPREAAFVAVLNPLIGTGPALTVALLTRAFLTLADLGLAAFSASVLTEGGAGSNPKS